LFVAPIYIQASQARMPQLEKVVLASGNELVYADTYPQALEILATRQRGGRPPISTATVVSENRPGAPSPGSQTDPRIQTIRSHVERYRSLTAQGKLADAGRELEAIEALVK